MPKLEIEPDCQPFAALKNGMRLPKPTRVTTRTSKRLESRGDSRPPPPEECASEAKSDVYEFNDDDSSKLDPLHLRKTKNSENVIQSRSDLTDGINTRIKAEPQTAVSLEDGGEEKKSPGGLKLTLRMKRSPVLDEVIESGNSLSEDSFEPEYEILRLEGVDSSPYSSCSHRKKRHKSKDRKRERRLRHIESVLGPPPMKRLKLIFGNESRTIDIPSTSTN